MRHNTLPTTMKKLYSTALFAYRCPLTPVKRTPRWYIVHKYQTAYWRCDEYHRFDAITVADNELYALRNSAINRGEDDDFLKSLVAEINKRQIIHPLLLDATKEQIDELYERTIKNAVKTKIKGVQEPLFYKHLLNDIKIWRTINEQRT